MLTNGAVVNAINRSWWTQWLGSYSVCFGSAWPSLFKWVTYQASASQTCTPGPLSLLPSFHSADMKIWSLREEVNKDTGWPHPLFTQAKGQVGPGGGKTASYLASGEVGRS
jgi:hypothetical protein